MSFGPPKPQPLQLSDAPVLITTPRCVAARLTWAASNHNRALQEHLAKERHAAYTAKRQHELASKVAQRREDAHGRVSTAVAALHERNRQHRRVEAKRQQFALAEKDRRLREMREKHREHMSQHYVTMDANALFAGDIKSYHLLLTKLEHHMASTPALVRASSPPTPDAVKAAVVASTPPTKCKSQPAEAARKLSEGKVLSQEDKDALQLVASKAKVARAEAKRAQLARAEALALRAEAEAAKAEAAAARAEAELAKAAASVPDVEMTPSTSTASMQSSIDVSLCSSPELERVVAYM